ncbi:MAG: aspartate--ammonia ligase [Oscillospiraceae bacterium]|nr:aspartate--ammonia ligase [Oscillospiraceae bacterium]
MNKVILPKNYAPVLNGYELQRAIALTKEIFQGEFVETLHLQRVSAPLFVRSTSGLNDDLSGKERAVAFDVPAIGDDAQVVHSLAKWKRLALGKYGFAVHEGLYTDMNAIRRDEELDNIHSIYVDQWDWERIIREEDRTPEYLKATVQSIVDVICDASEALKKEFPQIKVELCRQVSFVTSQELEDLYPDNTPEEREYLYLKEHKTAFIMQIGGKLRSGKPHGMRAPDYDDWTLNGDIIFWNDVLGIAFEISSMGIRVDPAAMDRQLQLANCNHRRALPFHKMLLEGQLPLTIGGGIGQSRLCMLLIGCAHIGEVQTSLWDDETLRICSENNIPLL